MYLYVRIFESGACRRSWESLLKLGIGVARPKKKPAFFALIVVHQIYLHVGSRYLRLAFSLSVCTHFSRSATFMIHATESSRA